MPAENVVGAGAKCFGFGKQCVTLSEQPLVPGSPSALAPYQVRGLEKRPALLERLPVQLLGVPLPGHVLIASELHTNERYCRVSP